MDIGIVTDACAITFDNVDAAVAFVLALGGKLTPEQFQDAVRSILHPGPEMMDALRDVVRNCPGPSA